MLNLYLHMSKIGISLHCLRALYHYFSLMSNQPQMVYSLLKYYAAEINRIIIKSNFGDKEMKLAITLIRRHPFFLPKLSYKIIGFLIKNLKKCFMLGIICASIARFLSVVQAA